MFICMPKMNFTIHFFIEILHFKESCNLTSQQHFGPKLENQYFAKNGIRSFPGKTNDKIFQKFKKKTTYFGAILGPFSQI